MWTIKDLVVVDRAWPRLQEEIRRGGAKVEALPPSSPAREAGLEWLQVTTGAELGAVAYETGGLLVDHGWLRILGSGHPRLPRSILDWNRDRTFTDGSTLRTLILVADDAMGGLFAIHCRSLGSMPGEVGYFPPHALRWEPIDMTYADFLRFSFSGRLAEFYADYRWNGWERDVEKMGTDRAFALAPPPFLKGEPFAERSRDAIPMTEHYALYQNFAEQFRDVQEGAKVSFRRGARPPA